MDVRLRALDSARPSRRGNAPARVRDGFGLTGRGRPSRPRRASRAERRARALPHLVAGAGRALARGLCVARRSARPRPECRASRRSDDSRLRVAQRRLVRAADPRSARRGHRRDTGCTARKGLPLALAQLRRARPGRRRPRRGRRCRRTGPAWRADRHPSRGIRLALQGAPPDGRRRRLRRGDAARPQTRRLAWGDGRARQGRLARRAAAMAEDRVDGRADAAGLAVTPRGARRRAAHARHPLRARQRLAPSRLPEGVHGRDARLADSVDARRLGRADHER